MLSPTALVLGGTHDHIRLLELLRERGYYTVLVDYYASPPARLAADEHCQMSTLDAQSVLGLAKSRSAKLVVAACIDQAMQTAAWVSECLRLPCHLSYSSAVERTNKLIMKRLFGQGGIPTASWSDDGPGLPEFLRRCHWPVVVKPADANSSKGVQRVGSVAEIPRAIVAAKAFSREGQVLVEEFRSGVEYSVDVVVRSGEPTVLMVTRNEKIASDSSRFTILENVYLSDEQELMKEMTSPIARKICRSFGINDGPVLIQLICSSGGISVVEFSSRIGGGSKHHFLKKMTGFDAIDNYLKVIHGESVSIPLVRSTVGASSMSYIYAKSGVLAGITGCEELRDTGVISDYYTYKSIGMEISGRKASSDRPAGFMIIGDSVRNLRSRVGKAEKGIRVMDGNGEDLMMHGIYGKW